MGVENQAEEDAECEEREEEAAQNGVRPVGHGRAAAGSGAEGAGTCVMR